MYDCQATYCTHTLRRIYHMTLALILLLSLGAETAAGQAYQTILPGDPALTTHPIEPYTAKYRMGRQGQAMAEVIVNVQTYAVGGRSAYRLMWDLGFPGQTVTDLSLFYQDTFAPVLQVLPAGMAPDAGLKMAFYAADSLFGAVVPRDGTVPTALRQSFQQPVFEGGIHHLLLAALPLVPSYAVQFPAGAAEGEGFIQARVVAAETIAVNERTYEAWRIELRQFNQTSLLWVSHEAPYLVRREIPGMNTTWELLEVLRTGVW